MNVDNLNGGPVDKQQRQHPTEVHKKELQQQGLRQAAEFYQQQSESIEVRSSQSAIGMKVVGLSMEASLEINGEKPRFKKDDAASQETENNGFDFEKVAGNVMRFVGNVIRGAADSGADDEKLSGLFSQAWEGVAKGIALARKDLGEQVSDEVSQGIKSSEDLISNKMRNLETELLPDTRVQSAIVQAAYGQSQSSELNIKTQEGDTVTVRFGASQSSRYEQTTRMSEDAQEGVSTMEKQTSFSFASFRGLEVSVEGALSEKELASIAQLVDQTGELADTFFQQDIDKAFEQALNMGFDEKTLAGFSLQLEKRETVGLAKAYSDIKALDENIPAATQQVKEISDYLDKMMKTFDLANDKLASPDNFSALARSIINQMEDVQVPDLISAINRFSGFNGKAREALQAD